MTGKSTDHGADSAAPEAQALASLKRFVAQAESAGDDREFISQLKSFIAEAGNTQPGDPPAQLTEALKAYVAGKEWPKRLTTFDDDNAATVDDTFTASLKAHMAAAERERRGQRVAKGLRAAKERRAAEAKEQGDGE